MKKIKTPKEILLHYITMMLYKINHNYESQNGCPLEIKNWNRARHVLNDIYWQIDKHWDDECNLKEDQL